MTLSLFLCWGTPQNTYTNADKLLEAAEQLAQTGECDPEEIYKAARHLEVRIQDFVRRVEQRKLLLDMSVSFHTHAKEVSLSPISILCQEERVCQGCRTGKVSDGPSFSSLHKPKFGLTFGTRAYGLFSREVTDSPALSTVHKLKFGLPIGAWFYKLFSFSWIGTTAVQRGSCQDYCGIL